MKKGSINTQRGLIDRECSKRLNAFTNNPEVLVSMAWYRGEGYRAMVVAVLALAGRPVKPEVFKELAEDEQEWADFCGAFTDLIHAGRIVPKDGKLVLAGGF